ncbi:hypothetical protein [Gracilinema caldarium]|uniref:Porin n=1 Tax=Gracilinema caldarium (strain ATCC 51460 / DSM 7334 / H1) TaxID=744872 RepID=F8EX51_GRAC1|nr:hypothetical protein [Gracilinema caldarium]AEJ18794.1 hypothetical protein Spica_0640 [Gracilinema caldarium DSM 7334]
MKKIVSLVLLLSISVGTIVFAQTPKLSLYARTSGSLGTIDLDESENNKSMNLGVSNTDTFGIEITDKMAGAKVSLKGSDFIDSSNGGTIVVDDYYGWMKFGDIKLTAGEWDHRYANRVTSDSSNFGGLWDLKYGVITRKAGNEGDITVAVTQETDNLTPWEVEFAADYIKDALTLSFSTGNTNDTSTYPNYKNYMVKDYFGVRGGYKIKDMGDVNASFVMNGENIGNFGFFVSPIIVKDLTLTVGYSGNYNFKTSSQNMHAAEMRARYVVMNNISITTHNNISFADKYMIIYDMLNVSYKINDTFVPCFMIANSNFSGDNLAWNGNVFTIRPGITLNAQKGAAIDIGMRYKLTDPKSGDTTKILDFPVVFRIKF